MFKIYPKHLIRYSCAKRTMVVLEVNDPAQIYYYELLSRNFLKLFIKVEFNFEDQV